MVREGDDTITVKTFATAGTTADSTNEEFNGHTINGGAGIDVISAAGDTAITTGGNTESDDATRIVYANQDELIANGDVVDDVNLQQLTASPLLKSAVA